MLDTEASDSKRSLLLEGLGDIDCFVSFSAGFLLKGSKHEINRCYGNRDSKPILTVQH